MQIYSYEPSLLATSPQISPEAHSMSLFSDWTKPQDSPRFTGVVSMKVVGSSSVAAQVPSRDPSSCLQVPERVSPAL